MEVAEHGCVHGLAINPITVTIVAVVCSASLLPFLFLPVLLVGNDPETMDELVNGRLANAVGCMTGRFRSSWRSWRCRFLC